MEKRFYTPQEAAQILGKDERTVRNWADGGLMPAKIVETGKKKTYLIPIAAFEAWATPESEAV